MLLDYGEFGAANDSGTPLSFVMLKDRETSSHLPHFPAQVLCCFRSYLLFLRYGNNI